MLRALALSVAALLTSTLALAAPASADDTVPAPAPAAAPTITVVGDSITSWFRDEPGSVSQGWWSMLAREMGASVTTLAEGGSGMNVRGNNCHGTTFGQRLGALQKVDYLIIQGGRNDMYTCTSKGVKKSLPQLQRKKGIASYLSRLGRRVDALGIPRERVLVMSPWGKADRRRGYQIQSYLRLYSNRKHEGFTYVETKTLPNSLTLDGKHPNRAGSTYLSDTVRRVIASLP
ncbi:SGNH/GDSL hydrolase family protein [Aeromicrobium sp. CFBP 8757]|uniref:SGNH/GDSL hydrolase family protein n=1 Tax=Aeromicrobium sp. CFBP 8757 TaxID=2775288 RepID=UPI00178406C5|nr:SGNH/GDSL hydrolase family protein [Aeromicrobium sp. CFBP 8757]MBD8606857.1 SGNH/GDSL hydrolase family protein [Aeromicrobium sp. CFBP 8757]